MNGIIEIKYNNKHYIDEFIENLGKSSDTFRYFQSRNSSVIEQHLVTYLYFIRNKPVAYGHLDLEDNVTWLGIAVAENYTGKGLGKLIMQHLTNFADTNRISSIRLSVDKTNLEAIKLYYKFNFIFSEEKNNTLFLERNTI